MADTATTAPVVVGLDDSATALTALSWAASYAALTGAPLLVVTVVAPAELIGRAAALDALPRRDERHRRAEEWLDAVVADHVRGGVAVVSTKVLDGHPVDMLVSESRESRLLVVGARGAGGFSRLLLGSVSTGVVHNATCPVVVVPASVAGSESATTGAVAAAR